MKRYVVWLDEDGFTHVSTFDAYNGEEDWIVAVIEAEENPLFYPDLRCVSAIVIEIG